MSKEKHEYQVLVTGVQTLVIEASSEEEAIEIARSTDFELDMDIEIDTADRIEGWKWMN